MNTRTLLLEIDNKINLLEATINSIYPLINVSNNNAASMESFISSINPDVKQFLKGEPSVENFLKSIGDAIKTMWQWLLDKLRTLWRFLTRAESRENNKKEKEELERLKKEYPETNVDELIRHLEDVYVAANKAVQDKWDAFKEQIKKDNEKDKLDYSLYSSPTSLKVGPNSVYGVYPIEEFIKAFKGYIEVLKVLESVDVNKRIEESINNFKLIIENYDTNSDKSILKKSLIDLNKDIISKLNNLSIDKDHVAITKDYGISFHLDVHHIDDFITNNNIPSISIKKWLEIYFNNFDEFENLHSSIKNIAASVIKIFINIIEHQERNTEIDSIIEDIKRQHNLTDSDKKTSEFNKLALDLSKSTVSVMRQIVKHISEIEHSTYTLHNGVRKSRKKLIRRCHEIQKIIDINSKLKSQTRVDRFKKQQEIRKSLQNKN